MKKIAQYFYGNLMFLPPFCHLSKRKQKVLFFSIVATAFVVCFSAMFGGIAHCINETSDHVCKHVECNLSFAIINSIISFKPLNNTFTTSLTKVVKLASTPLKGIMDACITPLGYSFCVAWFGFDLIDTLTSQQATPEMLMKKFIILIAGILLISNASSFTTDIPTASVSLSTDITKSITESKEITTDIGNMQKTWHSCIAFELNMKTIFGLFPKIIVGIFIWLFTLLFWLIAMACGMLLFVVKVTTAVEMCIRGAFIPIGCADVSKGIGNSIRYLKQYIGVGLQFAVINMATAGGASLGAGLINSKLFEITETNGFFDIDSNLYNNFADYANLFQILVGIITVLGIYVAVVMLCFRASQITRDIMS